MYEEKTIKKQMKGGTDHQETREEEGGTNWSKLSYGMTAKKLIPGKRNIDSGKQRGEKKPR